MTSSTLEITALDVARWADSVRARAVLPVLVRRLVQEGDSALVDIDFPGYDEAQRPDWDGWTVTTNAVPWIPEGRAGWELSVADDNPGKPNRDWTSRQSLDADQRLETTFVFVTARRWPGKGRWAEQRHAERLWREVRALDAEDLAQWLERSPATRLWFAGELGRPIEGMRMLDCAWRDWAEVCDPVLSPLLFDDAVGAATSELRSWREAAPHRPFVVTADSVDEALAFIACALLPQREQIIVVDRAIALPPLLAGGQGLLVIADPLAEAQAAAASHARHIVIARTHNSVPIDSDVILGPLARERFEAALSDMGIADHERDRLTTEAGRSPTILRRRLARSPELRVPHWARDQASCRKLVPILLAGAWKANDPADAMCVAELSGRPIEEVERDVATLAALPDAPVWSAGGYRGTVSRKDALFAIHATLTDEDLRRFFAVAELVLTLDDPRLDLPEDKRTWAGIYGVKAEASGAFRAAVGEMLVLLAIEGDRLLGARLGPIAPRVDHLVDKVLKGATPRQWLSQHHLRWLAEASPAAFLDAIEADLRQDEPALLALLRPVKPGGFGGCDRAELLWALELLAWDPATFPRVFAILAKLSETRIDDNYSDKPEDSLQSLVRCWLPQTAATIDERIAVLRRQAQAEDSVAWRLLLAQFPRHGWAHRNARPRWREVPLFAGGNPSWDDQRAMKLAALELIVGWRAYDVEQMGDAVQLIDQFPDDAIVKLLDRAEDWADAADDLDRATLRERLRRRPLLWRRKEEDDPQPWRERLRTLMERLEPRDLVERHRWLFADNYVPESWDEMHDEDGWEARGERLDAHRLDALREVNEVRGGDRILSLIAGGKAGWAIGRLLVTATGVDTISWIRILLGGSDRSAVNTDAAIAGLMFQARHSGEGEVLRAMLEDADLDEATALRVALAAPFDGRTWAALADLRPAVATAYWRQTRGAAHALSTIDQAYLVDRLLEAERPFAAFQSLNLHSDSTDPELIARVLRAMRASTGDDFAEARPEAYDIGTALACVAEQGVMPLAERASIEFLFFDGLRYDQHGTPALDRTIADSPADFVHLVALVYKRDDGQSEEREGQEAAATTAWSVLRETKRIPGSDDGGSIDEDRLLQWIQIARTFAREVARLSITEHAIGTLLAKSPVGLDGHWPHEAVRAALESVATESIGNGFVVGKRNDRGVHYRAPGGGQERALAAAFKADASTMRLSAPFTARCLEQLATDYEYDGARWDGEDQVERRLGRR